MLCNKVGPVSTPLSLVPKRAGREVSYTHTSWGRKWKWGCLLAQAELLYKNCYWVNSWWLQNHLTCMFLGNGSPVWSTSPQCWDGGGGGSLSPLCWSLAYTIGGTAHNMYKLWFPPPKYLSWVHQPTMLQACSLSKAHGQFFQKVSVYFSQKNVNVNSNERWLSQFSSNSQTFKFKDTFEQRWQSHLIHSSSTKSESRYDKQFAHNATRRVKQMVFQSCVRESLSQVVYLSYLMAEPCTNIKALTATPCQLWKSALGRNDCVAKPTLNH